VAEKDEADQERKS